MTAVIAVRLDASARTPSGALPLEWSGTGRDPLRADLDRLFEQRPPTDEAADLLLLAACVYAADKAVLRNDAPDRWGRRIELHVPQIEPARWNLARLTRLLHDLTADHWDIRTYASQSAFGRIGRRTRIPEQPFAAVTLFSGGLDSFAWAAAHGPASRALVSHSDTTALGSLQDQLANDVAPPPGSQLLRFWVRLRRRGALKTLAFERTTRSRSLLFLAAAAAVAQASGVERVTVPENGFISLNPPMVPARTGTLSTRSTHPRILAAINDLISEGGIDVAVENPFNLHTKGDVVGLAAQNCTTDAIYDTVSCARPSARKADLLHYGNCGYCFPCLVRRAGFHAAGIEDRTRYRRDPRTELDMLSRQSGDDFKAVVTGLRRPFGARDLRLGGALPPGSDVEGLLDVAERSRRELMSMIRAGLSSEVRTAIGW